MLFKNSIKTSKVRETVTALTNFMNNSHLGENLSSPESQRNIKDSLVDIVLKKKGYRRIEQWSSKGLLITDDGYFLTANHCLNHEFDKGYIENSNGKFRIEGVKSNLPGYDLVLAKANVPGECLAKEYKISNLIPTQDIRVISLIKEGSRIINFIGLINSFSEDILVGDKCKTYLDLISLFLPKGESGHSGSPVIDYNSNLMGLISAGNTHLEYIAKITHAMELISNYTNQLKEEYSV